MMVRLGKQEVVDRIHEAVGLPVVSLGPGSKERKSTLLGIAMALGVPVPPGATKTQVGAEVCRVAGVPWDESCYSAGDTITLHGLTTLMGLVEAHAQPALSERDEDVTDVMTDAEAAEGDQRSMLEGTVADLIAGLSAARQTPTEFAPSTRELEPSAVDFGSVDWVFAVADVQGWLRLPDSMDPRDPASFAEQLVSGLGVPAPQSHVVERDGTPTLDDLALDRLRERADLARRLQDAFLEDLEIEGGSVRTATTRWVDAWDEEPAELEGGSGPISARAGTWSINEFSDRAGAGELDLSPSWQRGDVWPTIDAQMLIESILRGIPLPSVILLKSSGDYAGAFEVVDGKQRLTAILRFIGKHPTALEHVQEAEQKYPGEGLEKAFQTDYPKFRVKWKNLTGEVLTATAEAKYYFPFKLRRDVRPLEGELKALQGKYYTEIRESIIPIGEERTKVRNVFERTMDYKIPLIEYSKASRRQVHEVFNLYNKQGKHLNAEEIRNAFYHDLDLMRGLIVAAGDNRDVARVAPFLQPVWDEVGQTPDALQDYGFGVLRYKRTKLLSWLASVLLVGPQDGKPRRLSTARHIDHMLSDIERDNNSTLRRESALRDLFTLLWKGIEAHSSAGGAWAPAFRNAQKHERWQELQLVASLVGVTCAATVLGDATTDALEQHQARLLDLTAKNTRPAKTQTTDQWQFIAATAIGVLEILGVDEEQASSQLRERFGSSGLRNLQAWVGRVGA